MSMTCGRAEIFRRVQPRRAASGNGDFAAEIFCQRGEHQTDRPSAENQNILSRAQFQIFDSLHDARERFGERGIAEIRLRFQAQKIFLGEPRRDDD